MNHRVSLADLTVIHTDRNGEDHDLNANGKPCESLDDLRDFIVELCDVGMIDNGTRIELLAQVSA